MASEKRNEPLRRAIRLIDTMYEPDYEYGMTIEEIAETLGQEVRTAYRLIDTLEELGCIIKLEPNPLHDDPQKRKKVLYSANKLKHLHGITSTELGTLERIANGDRYLEQERKDLRSILIAIKRATEDNSESFFNNLELIMQTEGYAVRPTPRCKVNEEVIKIIRDSIKDKYKIRCDYENKKGEKKRRLLSPLGFLYGTQKTYLIARMDNKDNQPITFRVDKISNVVRALDQFDPGDFDLRAYANTSFGIWHDEEKMFDVKLSFSADVAKSVLEYDFHPTQEIKQEDDGTVTVTFRASGDNEILWHLFTWGDKCKILEPAKLKDTYVSMLDSVKKVYS